MNTEDTNAARRRTVAALDRHLPDWMWPILADELERLEANEQSEVVLCMDNTGKFYLAEPAKLSRLAHSVQRWG